MSDSFTEVTSTNWFQRLGNSFKGILVGILLFIIAFPVLFLNEQSEVKRFKALAEGLGAVVSVSSTNVDPANNGKLVHITGITETKDVLTDSEFGISEVAIRMRRHTEMYQWKENRSSRTEKQLGGGTKTTTTYSYEKVWSSSLISSSSFKKSGHANPTSMPYESKSWSAQTVNVGSFFLNSGQIQRTGVFQSLTVSPVSNQASVVVQGQAKVVNNAFYFGSDPASPSIGDVRVTFSKAAPGGPISVVAQQSGNTFVAYRSKVVKGQSINLLKNSTMTAEEMFEAAKNERKMLTWILRLVGLFLMVIGLNMILKPLSTVLDVIPLLGNIAGGISGVVAAVAGFAFAFITISISWVINRPVIGIPLLVVGVAALVGARMLKSSKSSKPKRV